MKKKTQTKLRTKKDCKYKVDVEQLSSFYPERSFSHSFFTTDVLIIE